MSLEGQFLHYIHRHQFLDSPEWESLRPNEEGKFQVWVSAVQSAANSGSKMLNLVVQSLFDLKQETPVVYQVVFCGLLSDSASGR